MKTLLNIPYTGRGHVYPHHIYSGQEETYYVDLPTALLCALVALIIFIVGVSIIVYIGNKIINKYYN